jgi:hypothetical protein
MRQLAPGLQTHLDSGTTTLCHCWRVTLKSGEKLGFTDHDLDLNFDGTVFEASAGFTASSIALQRGDLIQLDENLYVVGAHSFADASGVASVSLTTGLIVAITTVSAVTITEPAARMRLDAIDWAHSQGWSDQYVQAQLRFIEVA